MHIHFAKQVFLHIVNKADTAIISIKLYMLTTTKTKLNIRHLIHVRIQHDKKYITHCILNF